MKSIAVVFVLCFTLAMSQRSPYAGSRPVGSFANQNTGNRNDPSPAAAPASQQPQQAAQPAQQPQGVRPSNLPHEAGGDVNYYNYLQSLPQNQQPFWLLNQQHIAANRNQPSLQVSPFGQPIQNFG